MQFVSNEWVSIANESLLVVTLFASWRANYVERFTAFETGDREKFAAFIRSLMQAYCPDAALIDDVAIDIDDAISALNESEEISKNEELSADKDSNLRNNPDSMNK